MPDPKEIFKVPKEGEYEGQRVCTIALRPKDRGVSSRVFPSADNQEIHKKLQKRAKLSQCETQKNVPSEDIEENGKKQQKIPRWDVPADASDTLKAFGKFMNDCNEADAEETLSHLTTGEIAEREVFSDSDSDSSYVISDEEERASTYQNTSVKSSTPSPRGSGAKEIAEEVYKEGKLENVKEAQTEQNSSYDAGDINNHVVGENDTFTVQEKYSSEIDNVEGDRNRGEAVNTTFIEHATKDSTSSNGENRELKKEPSTFYAEVICDPEGTVDVATMAICMAQIPENTASPREEGRVHTNEADNGVEPYAQPQFPESCVSAQRFLDDLPRHLKDLEKYRQSCVEYLNSSEGSSSSTRKESTTSGNQHEMCTKCTHDDSVKETFKDGHYEDLFEELGRVHICDDEIAAIKDVDEDNSTGYDASDEQDYIDPKEIQILAPEDPKHPSSKCTIEGCVICKFHFANQNQARKNIKERRSRYETLPEAFKDLLGRIQNREMSERDRNVLTSNLLGLYGILPVDEDWSFSRFTMMIARQEEYNFMSDHKGDLLQEAARLCMPNTPKQETTQEQPENPQQEVTREQPETIGRRTSKRKRT